MRRAAPALAAAAALAAVAAAPAPAPAGAAVRAFTGEHVDVVRDAGAGAHPAADTAWADFFAGLPHGPELATLRVVLTTPDGLIDACGPDAGGCYSPAGREMVLPAAESVPGRGSVVADVARHEYGHHVAFSVPSAPFPRGTGTRRWFTATGMCRRLRDGSAVASPRLGYARSAVEGFAEAYRVAAGGNPHTWIVDPLFFPSRRERAALLADVADPWTGPVTVRRAGRLAAGAVRTHVIRVPLDGTVGAAVRGPGDARVTIAAPGRPAETGRRRAAITACGARRVAVTVASTRGGRYRLDVTRP